MPSPGIGFAAWRRIAPNAPSLPSSVSTALAHRRLRPALKRARADAAGGRGLWPASVMMAANFLATMLAMRFPMPMSLISSFDLCSIAGEAQELVHIGSNVLAFETRRAVRPMPSAAQGLSQHAFRPKSCDSLCAMVLRWWRILERGPSCAHKAQPRSGVGRRHGGGDDFHHIAIAQLGAQWHLLAIDFGKPSCGRPHRCERHRQSQPPSHRAAWP